MRFSRRGKIKDEEWNGFAPHLSYLTADFTNADSYAKLRDYLGKQDNDWQAKAHHIFYLATAPSMIEVIARQLHQVQLFADEKRSRLVVEKPFGHDLDSARTAQSPAHQPDARGSDLSHRSLPGQGDGAKHPGLSLRQQLSRADLESPLHRSRADHRGRAGRRRASRRLLRSCRRAARHDPEPPAASAVLHRHGAARFLRRQRGAQQEDRRAQGHPPAFRRDQVSQFAVRGQYDMGNVEGKTVPAYRQEPDVPGDSPTETYAAVKLYVDNWRWQDVPFYLRTGKRLPDARFGDFRPVSAGAAPLVPGRTPPPTGCPTAWPFAFSRRRRFNCVSRPSSPARLCTCVR